MLHRSFDLLGESGLQLYKAIQKLKDDGIVKKIGVSIYSPVELDAIFPQFRVDIVQAPFNLIDQRLLITGWLDHLKNCEIEIHTSSSFLQGLLLIPRDRIPEKFARWNSLWDYWSGWLRQGNMSAAKVCIDFVQSFEQIDRIIIGADNSGQLNQLVELSSEPPNLVFPTMSCDDENLINPANWLSLGR
jgi:hypothetical protein